MIYFTLPWHPAELNDTGYAQPLQRMASNSLGRSQWIDGSTVVFSFLLYLAWRTDGERFGDGVSEVHSRERSTGWSPVNDVEHLPIAVTITDEPRHHLAYRVHRAETCMDARYMQPGVLAVSGAII